MKFWVMAFFVFLTSSYSFATDGTFTYDYRTGNAPYGGYVPSADEQNAAIVRRMERDAAARAARAERERIEAEQREIAAIEQHWAEVRKANKELLPQFQARIDKAVSDFALEAKHSESRDHKFERLKRQAIQAGKAPHPIDEHLSGYPVIELRAEIRKWKDSSPEKAQVLDLTKKYDTTVSFFQSNSSRLSRETYDLTKVALRAGFDSLTESAEIAGGSREGDFSEAYQTSLGTHEIAKALLDVGLGLTPGVSLGKDVYEALSGYSLLDHSELDFESRTFAVLGVATGGGGTFVKGMFNGLKRVAKFGRARSLVAHGFGKITQMVDSAARILRKNPTAEELSWYANLTKRTGSIEKAEALSQEITTLSKELQFTETTAKRMETAGRFVPQEMLAEAIKTGTAVPDPQGAAGATKYIIDMFKNGKKYELEVIFREADKTILHFLYK